VTDHWKKIGVVIAGLGFAASLLLNVSTVVKATPSRAEMRAADLAMENRTQRELSEIKQLVKDVRNLQLEMLMGSGGDLRGEGN
jgi:hypothetical protein